MDREHVARAARIRELNDKLRKDFRQGLVLITPGLDALELPLLCQILDAVRAFSDFSQNNDAQGEHDFGSFAVNDHRLIWKIDYYDRSQSRASIDPCDPAVTTRVLTIMLAEEW